MTTYSTTSPSTRKGDEQDWKVLRSMMLGDQVREVALLKEMLEQMSEQNRVLAERIRLTFQQQSVHHAQQLRTAVGPATVDWMAQLNTAGLEEQRNASESAKYLLISSLERTSQSSPGDLARILTPVLGPTIRSYVKAIFQQLITQMDAMMRRANIFQRLSWRLHAWRKGMSYAEYVVLQTTNFSVIHAHLTNRETDETVAEVGTDMPTGQENDPFVAQSALASALGNQLHPEWETVRLSGQTLALQLRTLGPCPSHVRMQAEQVLSEAETLLAANPGNAASTQCSFASQLNHLLDTAKKPSPPILGLVTFGLALASLAGWSGWQMWQRHQEQALVQKFMATPGYVVHNSSNSAGKLRIRGLRDPLSVAPENLLADAGIPARRVEFDFTGFRSLDSSFERTREAISNQLSAARDEAQQRDHESLLDQLMKMEQSRKAFVEAMFRDDLASTASYPLIHTWTENGLTVSGECPEESVAKVRQTAENLAKVVAVDLKITPKVVPPWSDIRRLEAQDIPFVSGTVQQEATAPAALEALLLHLSAADAAWEDSGKPLPSLRLRAWPISGVWAAGNQAVQLERFRVVQAALIKAGVKPERFQPGVLDSTSIHGRQGVWVEWMSESGR